MHQSAHSSSADVPQCSAVPGGIVSLLGSLQILLLTAAALAPSAQAATENRPWQVHGFLSQAAFHTSDNNIAGDSDDGISTDFNEAGLNGSLNLPYQLRVAGQIMARNAGNYDNGELRTDYFNIDWQYLTRPGSRAGVRVGRVRNAFGLYNETRDVAHTRPSITLPSVIYLEQARDLNISRDGVGLYSDIFTDRGTLAIEAGAGLARVSDRLVKEALWAEGKGIEPDDAKISMLALSWEDAAGHWRFSFSQYHITSDVEFALGSFIPGIDLIFEGDFVMDTSLLSAQYSAERWQLTMEWLRFDYDLDLDFVARRYPGEGAYLQYNWLFSPSWQIYGRYEYGVMDRHNRNGSSMEQFCGDAVLDDYCRPRHGGYRRDTSIGLRWDINAQWMTAIEAHYVEGTMGLPYSDNPNADGQAPYWTLLALELAFRF